MNTIIAALLGAFSFLSPPGGMLTRSMGFFGYNPARSTGNDLIIGGSLGTLDTREANVEISSERMYFRTTYHNFGKLEVRGNIPQDEDYIASYPYLFAIEIGSNVQPIQNTQIGLSASLFQQRIMTDELKGYAINIGVEHYLGKAVIGGYIRNIGPRIGYVENERYSLPIRSSIYALISKNKNTFSVSIDAPGITFKESAGYIGYVKKISYYATIGGELALEKDLSIGHRIKYPLKFMLKASKNKFSVGYLVEVPLSSGFNLKNTLYMRIKI